MNRDQIRKRMQELAAQASLNLRDFDDPAKAAAARSRHESKMAEFDALKRQLDADRTLSGHSDATDAQFASLQSRGNLARVVAAITRHELVDGVEREVQQEYGLSGNQIPLSFLQTRAVTPAPGNVQSNQAPVIPGVFPQSVAAFLGIDMPTVGVGEAIFPVLTTNAVVRVPAENAAATETTGAFSADVLSPSRLQASFFWSREDAARFAGMDQALRENLGMAMSDALDREVLTGTEGLLTGTKLENHAAAAETDYAGYRSSLAYARVDGTYAPTVAELRVVMGSATYAHAANKFRSDNAGDRSAIEDLENVTAGVRVSAHVPAATTKQLALVRLGTRRDMVAPVWQGVTLIPDEITKAAKGEIVMTAVMLHAVKILRVGGFWKQQTQHS